MLFILTCNLLLILCSTLLLTKPAGLILAQPERLRLVAQLVERYAGHADDHAGAQDAAVAQEHHQLLAEHGQMSFAQRKAALLALMRFALFAVVAVAAVLGNVVAAAVAVVVRIGCGPALVQILADAGHARLIGRRHELLLLLQLHVAACCCCCWRVLLPCVAAVCPLSIRFLLFFVNASQLTILATLAQR